MNERNKDLKIDVSTFAIAMEDFYFFSFLSQSSLSVIVATGAMLGKRTDLARSSVAGSPVISSPISTLDADIEVCNLVMDLKIFVWQAREMGISWFPSWNCEKLLCN